MIKWNSLTLHVKMNEPFSPTGLASQVFLQTVYSINLLQTNFLNKKIAKTRRILFCPYNVRGNSWEFKSHLK